MPSIPSDPNAKVVGSCACHKITFVADVLPTSVVSCYCVECAKVSGVGYLTFAHFLSDRVKWSQEPDIWPSSSAAERGHCARCGSAVMMRYKHDSTAYVVVSMIDYSSEPLPKVECHMFVKEKADWVVIQEDGAERFPGFPISKPT